MLREVNTACQPAIEFLSARLAKLEGMPDPDVLALAAEQRRHHRRRDGPDELDSAAREGHVIGPFGHRIIRFPTPRCP
jgi:hypothetical protein